MEWTFRRGAWTFDRCLFGRRAFLLSPKPTIMDKSSERKSHRRTGSVPIVSIFRADAPSLRVQGETVFNLSVRRQSWKGHFGDAQKEVTCVFGV